MKIKYFKLVRNNLNYGEDELNLFLKENNKVKIIGVRIFSKNYYIEYDDVKEKTTATCFLYRVGGLGADISKTINEKLFDSYISNFQWDICEHYKEAEERAYIIMFWEESNPISDTILVPNEFPLGCIFKQLFGNYDDGYERNDQCYVQYPDGTLYMLVPKFGMKQVDGILHNRDPYDMTEETFRERLHCYGHFRA